AAVTETAAFVWPAAVRQGAEPLAARGRRKRRGAHRLVQQRDNRHYQQLIDGHGPQATAVHATFMERKAVRHVRRAP
ncbi:MAG: hypothetical protein ACRDG7_05040, partial [Candidatus Limnocylindria bacterium]